MTLSFSIELAQQLVESEDTFPVDLEDAVIWLGYSRKENALNTLKSYFEEGEDFICSTRNCNTGGRPSHVYLLTLHCFKSFALFSKTKGASQVLNCFKECGHSPIISIVKQRLEIDFKDLLFSLLEWKTLILTQHYCTFDNRRYFVDFYIPEYNLAIEYDEKYHDFQEAKDKNREQIISKLLNCKFIRVKEGKELEAISQIAQYIFQ